MSEPRRLAELLAAAVVELAGGVDLPAAVRVLLAEVVDPPTVGFDTTPERM